VHGVQAQPIAPSNQTKGRNRTIMSKSLSQQLLAATSEAEALSVIRQDAQQEKRFQFLLSHAKSLRTLIEIGSEKETVSEEETRSFVRSILTRKDCYRTYVPMASSGSQLVAQQFERQIVEAMAAIGPIHSDSPLVTSISCEQGESGPSKMPTLDDTASTGFLVDESVQETDGVTSPKNVTLTLQKFSSGILLYSMELGIDSYEALSQILSAALGRRISRIQNSTFTSSLLTALGANSSATLTSETTGIISEMDLIDTISAVSSVYRPNASFVLSESAQTQIGKLKTSGGLPIFPEVMAAQPKLLGYPVYLSAYLDDVASGNTCLLYGDFSTVFIKSLAGFNLRTLTERYVDQGSYALVLHKRAGISYGIQSTSDSAIKMLQIR
jgi:HK97 family phage major capsid protein